MSDEDKITLKIKDVNGEETFFKVKKTMLIKKVADAYCKKKGLAEGSVRFLVDGERIDLSETPKTLELEEGDQIDVMQVSPFLY